MAEQGDVCPDCGRLFGRGPSLCEGIYANTTDKNLCLMRKAERLKAKLAQTMKVVEAADRLTRFLPTENDAAMDAADAYDTERAKLKELP